MRNLLSIIAFATSVAAFSPIAVPTKTLVQQSKTQLNSVKRRDVLITGIMGLIASPQLSHATGSTFFFDENIENVREASQMPTGGKVDLNSAFVGEYKAFPGMFPHAAGKIASNGPYASVKDIYKIPGLTENDLAMFKKYEKEFTVNPPGRAFYERINARVST